MSVPNEDIVCRFIRGDKDYWSTTLNRPKPNAFKDPELSVWDVDVLRTLSTTIRDLQFDDFAGTGQAQHSVQQYYDFAKEASEEHQAVLEIQVEFRPSDRHVRAPWRKWRDAHAQVEITKSPPPPEPFPYKFRQKLAEKCRMAIPPDGMS